MFQFVFFTLPSPFAAFLVYATINKSQLHLPNARITRDKETMQGPNTDYSCPPGNMSSQSWNSLLLSHGAEPFAIAKVAWDDINHVPSQTPQNGHY